MSVICATVETEALLPRYEFVANAHGQALLGVAVRGQRVEGVPDVSSLYDVWRASFEVSHPAKLDEALGLVDAAIVVDVSLMESTKRKYRQEVARLLSSAVLRELQTVEDLIPIVLAEIVAEATERHGRWVEASISKRRFRRSVFSYFFRALQELGLVDANPAARLRLPSRPSTSTRPLTDTEMQRCEDVAYYGTVPDTRPVALALAQCGAATGEAALVRAHHVDLNAGTIHFPGSTYTYARVNPMTDWAHRTLGDRVAELHFQDLQDRPLVVGLDVTGESATAMVSTYLRDLLRLARLSDHTVSPVSIRAWGARKAYDRDGLEAAAAFLGFSSFDRTADVVGLERRK
jgi:integrase